MRNIVTCLPDYAYGHAQLRGFERVVASSPGVKHTNIMIPVGTPDMKPFLAKALVPNPDVVMMGLWATDAATILRQAHEMNMQKETQLFFNWLSDALVADLPPEAMDGVKCQMFLVSRHGKIQIQSISRRLIRFQQPLSVDLRRAAGSVRLGGLHGSL